MREDLRLVVLAFVWCLSKEKDHNNTLDSLKANGSGEAVKWGD